MTSIMWGKGVKTSPISKLVIIIIVLLTACYNVGIHFSQMQQIALQNELYVTNLIVVLSFIIKHETS